MPDITPSITGNSVATVTPKQLDGMSKIAAATAMAQTLSYSIERKFLQITGNEDALCSLRLIGDRPEKSLSGYYWLKISQVGRFSPNSKQNCFEAMQTILHSCHMPDTSLTFILLGDDRYYSLYLGCRGRKRFSALRNFISANWKGVVSERAIAGDKNKENNDPALDDFFSKDKYETCYAITGVPTLSAHDQFAKNIDQIIGACNHHKNFAYLVTANPIAEENIDGILSECRDLQSQAESFKGFSLSESLQKSESRSDSHNVSHTVTTTISQQITAARGDGKNVKKTILAVTGLAVAAAIFYPPALALLPKAATKIQSIPRLKSVMSIMSTGSKMQSMAIAKGLIPTASPQRHDNAEADSQSDTTTTGFSESYTKSVSQTISNAHVEAAVEHLKKHSERFQMGKAIGMWEVGCYIFTDSDDGGVTASQIKAVLSGAESVYEPMRIHDVSDIIREKTGFVRGFDKNAQIYAEYSDKPEYGDEIFRHPFGADFSRLTTFLTTKELSCMVNLPTSPVPGINVVDIWPDFSLSVQNPAEDAHMLPLGHLIYDRTESNVPVDVDINTFNRHSLVAGVNGSGKTNTVLNIMEGFMNTGRPILVFEPAKTEYVDWAIEYNREVEKYNAIVSDAEKRPLIKIFIPGCRYYAKGKKKFDDALRLNPFEIIRSKHKESGYGVVAHLDRLKSVLAGAFPMQDILPTVIERLLYKLYTDKGWLREDGTYPELFPTLKDINLDFVKDLMAQLGYAEENTMNISAALRTRFNSMKQGWKGELLNNERLDGITWDELFSSPCIINLSYVGDDSDKAFIMSLIMQFLYEYRMAEAEADDYTFNDNECRHLAVIEEAHRVMTKCPSPELPQYRSNQMFASILSEVRAYGQGVMVVDQVPSRLIEDAVKNTNIKIIHKIVASDDAKMLAESIGLTQDQQDVIPKLSIGQAILVGLNSLNINSQNASDIYLAKIAKKKKKKNSQEEEKKNEGPKPA